MNSYPQYMRNDCLACGWPDSLPFTEMNGYELRRCVECRTIYTKNVPSSAQLVDYYRPNKNTSDDGVFVPKRTFHRRWKYQIFRAYVRRLFRKQKRPIDLVEIGCSDGDLLEVFVGDEKFSVTGLDYSEANVRYCCNIGANALCSDLESARLPSESSDMVVAIHVVEHMQDPVRTLEEVYRVLRPGGYVFAVMPCSSHFKARRAGINWKYLSPPGHLWYFSTKGLALFAERAGFETHYSSCFYHRAHVRLLARKPLAATAVSRAA